MDDKTVDLTYEVEEKSSDNINASVGYSGAFGVTGALGFTINNFSIAEPLSGGAGQILNFEWQFGEASRYRTFTLGFTEPWLFDTPTLLGRQPVRHPPDLGVRLRADGRHRVQDRAALPVAGRLLPRRLDPDRAA